MNIGFLIYIIFFAVIFISIFTTVIVTFIKNAKSISNISNKSTEKSTNLFEKITDTISNEVQCPYCKTTYSKTEKKCPGCGASKPRK